MRKLGRLCVFPLALLLMMAAGALPGAQGAAPPKSRSFEFEYDTLVKVLPPSARTLRLWIPVPQSGPYQQITHLRIESPVPFRLRREPQYGDRYAYLEVAAGTAKTPFEVRLKFDATRREHRVDLADPPVTSPGPDPTSTELAMWLKPDRLVPIDGVIGDLSRQQTRGIPDPLGKARAIYNYVEATMRYDKSGTGWGRGDAVFACDNHRGNCTDFHSLFIGMARAAGIPAKFEIGFPLPPDRHAGEIPGYHCWAEFYTPSTGWVPVDASEAWQNPARRNYYFGAHDADRIQFTIGRDIRLNPLQKGDPLNYFIYPYAELDGKSFDGVEHQFRFHDLPERTTQK